MRAYAAVPPSVWQTDIKKLRGDPLAVAVYFHLLTSPHATMIGIYPLDLQYVAIDLGSPLEGASKGLRRVIEGGLASYDEEHELVWVHEMAVSQIASRLSPKDNRVSAVARLLAQLPICRLTLDFYDRYGVPYHLRNHLLLEEFERAMGSPFEAPSEPLRSQEQEQDKDQDLGTGQDHFRTDDERYGSRPSQSFEEPQPERPYTKRPTLEANRLLVIELGVPQRHREDAIRRLMQGALFPCDIADWKREERHERAA